MSRNELLRLLWCRRLALPLFPECVLQDARCHHRRWLVDLIVRWVSVSALRCHQAWEHVFHTWLQASKLHIKAGFILIDVGRAGKGAGTWDLTALFELVSLFNLLNLVPWHFYVICDTTNKVIHEVSRSSCIKITHTRSLIRSLLQLVVLGLLPGHLCEDNMTINGS